MDYPGWINTICAALEYQVANAASATPTGVPAFDNSIPASIDYTENRLQRDLNLLATEVTGQGNMTTNNRLVTLPTGGGVYIVCSQIRPIVAAVKQQPLEPVTRDYLDFAWPSDASPGANILPVQWCPNNQSSIFVGPAPDQNYGFEVLGTIRVVQLSATNTTNFLTLQLPDMYVAASLVWWFQYQQNADMVTTWEVIYQGLLKGATVEETRKQFAGLFPSPSTPAGLTSQG